MGLFLFLFERLAALVLSSIVRRFLRYGPLFADVGGAAAVVARNADCRRRRIILDKLTLNLL